MTAEYEGWALLELMGHRVRPGYVTEVEIAGAKMLRVDIPVDGPMIASVTEYYGPSAVYALRPATEDLVRSEAAAWRDPRPVRPVDYRDRPKLSPTTTEDEPDEVAL